MHLSKILRYFVPDIDECAEGSDRCHQKCINTVGSYDCQCLLGYKENADGYSCQGRAIVELN